MASDERKLAKSSLIPLEIDPASVLSLSKGAIFDTIVHNVEYTLNNRLTDSLPWKLTGMSLICDPSRNKKYMQKLQKMQCVPSVICTQIYHSKLIKTESGVLSTPGRKIIIPTSPRKRLTGIIVCRSIDELLYMEPPNTENVHFIQYKLLSYERIATRELVNGPKIPAVGDKIIKTVFDFELTQINGFPRQLLPVAIISFARQDGCDLCASIRTFLNLDEHKTFDKSYLVTKTNVEFDRLRDEQERKEDADAEQELPWEKIPPRQPLADLSAKSTDPGNTRPVPVPQPSPRVPPIKLKLARPKQPSGSTLPLHPRFQCALKLNKVNLSKYDISNLPSPSQIKTKKLNDTTVSADGINNKTKSLTITKPYEHHKPLKRLNNIESKKQTSPPLSEISKEKLSDESISRRLSINVETNSSVKAKINQRSISASSMSPIYRSKPPILKRTDEKVTGKKLVKRPILPSEYHCSISLSQIDLSMYDVDLSDVAIVSNSTSMNERSILTTSPSNSSSSEQQSEVSNLPVIPEDNQDAVQPMAMADEDDILASETQNIFDIQPFDSSNVNKPFPNIIDEFLTPDLNQLSSDINMDVSPSSINTMPMQTTNESALTTTNEHSSDPPVEILPQVTSSELTTEVPNEVQVETSTENLLHEVLTVTTNDTLMSEIELQPTSEVLPTISSDENLQSTSPNRSMTFSPELPPLDDDPVLFSINNPQIPEITIPDTAPQDYIIIVPCSDDEDDFDDEAIHDTKNITIKNDQDNKSIESFTTTSKTTISPVLSNALLTRVLTNINRSNSDRLSISSSSSCSSSVSTSILHNQSPRSPLHLPPVLLTQKILNKHQRKSSSTITFNRANIFIPLFAHEPLIDPRLIYRLQAITTDLRWPSPCDQCLISTEPPSFLTSSTQMISYDRKNSTDYVDPRRESLKNAILHSIYQRMKLLIPNIFIIDSNQFQKLLFEQTNFKTNCSLHLEYLLQKIKVIDDMNFFQMMKTNDEFQLSPFLLQLIFN